jgi:MoxR-like ATPase
MNKTSVGNAPVAPSPPARDAILELKGRIGQSVLGQDHLIESMLIGRSPTAIS